MLSGERSLYWKLTGRENLEYFAALYHVQPKDMKARIDTALAAVKLSDRGDDYVERYSTGMRQRLALARALLPDPPLVILDEPTVGLDPQSARDLRDRVRDLRTQGRTVLLTTHYMEEKTASSRAIIDHGKIVALTPCRAEAHPRRGFVRLDIGLAGDGAPLLERLARIGTVARQERTNGTLAVTIHCASARELVPAAFDATQASGGTVRHVEVVPVTLEDVFLSLTGRALRE